MWYILKWKLGHTENCPSRLPQAVICPWLYPSVFTLSTAPGFLWWLQLMSTLPSYPDFPPFTRCYTQILKLTFFPLFAPSCLTSFHIHSCSPRHLALDMRAASPLYQHQSSEKGFCPSLVQRMELPAPIWVLSIEEWQPRPRHRNFASKMCFYHTKHSGHHEAFKLFWMVTFKSLSRLKGLMTFYLGCVLFSLFLGSLALDLLSSICLHYIAFPTDCLNHLQ